MTKIYLLIVGLAVLFLAGCGSAAAPATALPPTQAAVTTNTPTALPPTVTNIPPTATQLPSATRVPNTNTPAPTATAQDINQSFGGLDSQNNTGGLTVDAAYPTLPSAGKSSGAARPTQAAVQPTKPSQPTQAPSASSGGQQDDETATVVYQTKFDSCDGYPEVDNERGAFGCKNGEYLMTPSEKGLRYVSIPGEYAEGVYQITGRVVQDGGEPVEYGLFFGLTPDFSSGYSVSVRSDGTYNASRIQDGKFQDLLPYTRSPRVTDRNKIGIIHQNGKIAFFLNDELVDTIFDQPAEGNGLAIWTYSNASNFTTAFDDAGISKLNRVLNFPTPQAAASNPATEPTQNKPTPPPPPPTEPPQPTPEPSQGESNGCRLAQGEAGLIISNGYAALMTLTIGGGDWGMHDYDIPGDGERYLVTFPAGIYTYSVTIAGIGSDEGEPYEYVEGTCREISYSAQ